MKALKSLIYKIYPAKFDSLFDSGFAGRNYVRFRFTLCSIMIFISSVPMLIVAGLGYYNYGNLVQKTELRQLEWQVDGKLKSMEHMVESLASIVEFTAREDRYNELITGSNLESLFIRLKRQYAFFADIGVIDHLGIQQAYFGPYPLMGTDYSKETWFQEVLDRDVHISHVYTGYRQVPHFSIAVSSVDPNTQSTWVLRATIDAATLQKFVNTIKTDASDDLFIIDEGALLQTESFYYGKTLLPIHENIVPGIRQVISADGEQMMLAARKIAHTPWTLVLLKRHFIHQDSWKNFRTTLFTIIVACLVICTLIGCSLVYWLIGMIKRADEMQIAMLKEAEHTDKLASIGRLAAGVGHEINNPLAIIDQKKGLAEDLLLLTGDFEHKKEITACLQGVGQSVDRCRAITHRLLGFARRTDVATERLQVNHIIKDVLLFLENALLYSRIMVDLHLHDELPEIESDCMQLQQIFLNIINNAIDAIGKNGTISIMTHRLAGFIRVVVQDDGPGISEEILPHIFEPFYTTKDTGKGTGLGLSITYGLIKKLGGDITVRTNVGQGTAFTITFPLHGGS